MQHENGKIKIKEKIKEKEKRERKKSNQNVKIKASTYWLSDAFSERKSTTVEL